MRAAFPLGKKQSSLGVLPDPVIRIPILTKQGYQNFDFLVDTGADCSIMPKSVASDLPFDIEDCQAIRFVGIGGEIVTARVGAITAKIVTKPIEITCAFSPKENTPFILGRKDVFTHFSILFDNAKKLICFTQI